MSFARGLIKNLLELLELSLPWLSAITLTQHTCLPETVVVFHSAFVRIRIRKKEVGDHCALLGKDSSRRRVLCGGAYCSNHV